MRGDWPSTGGGSVSPASGVTKRVGVFVLLTALLSAPFEYLAIRAGDISANGGLFALGGMWSPGIAALITKAIYRREVGALGWGWGRTRYQVWSLLIPFLYALVGYALIWGLGLGDLVTERFGRRFGLFALGTLVTCVATTGEEIGWSGFLVPEVARAWGYTAAALARGIIWSVWHYPLIIGGIYRNASPLWYNLICFTVFFISISFVFAWLRLRSGSLWTGTFMHASHNASIQNLFAGLTASTALTPWFSGEFGAALALVSIPIAYAFWRRREAASLSAAKTRRSLGDEMRATIVKAGVLSVAMVAALGAPHAAASPAQPQAQHLPVVAEYGAVLAYSVALAGDNAYIGTTTGIAILRVADPANIRKLSSIDTLRDSRCVVAGRCAFASSHDDGLVVIDVANPASPRILGRHRGTAGYSDLQVSGRHAYAVVSTGGLDVIDISDPARPTPVGAVSWVGTAGRVRLCGQTAYVSRGEGGVQIVDVSQATAPAIVGEIAFAGRSGLIALVNGHLAVSTEGGVCLYDLSAPRAPALRKLLPGRLSDICSDGDRTLFVHSRNVVTVLDLSDIDSPRVIGTIGSYFHDLARRGDLVFGVLTGLKVYRLTAGLPDFVKSAQAFPTGVFQIAAADLDGDGDQDAAFSCAAGPSHVFLNDGKGTFSDSGQVFPAGFHGVAIGDLDRDGAPDIVFGTHHADRSCSVYINDGHGRFADRAVGNLGPGIAVFLVDLEQDGDLDIVLELSGGDVIYLNDGKARFTRGGMSVPGYAGLGDLNGDGYADWLLNRGGRGFETALNDGKGGFLEPVLFPKPDLISRFHALADLDSDGDNDVVYSNGEGEIHPSGILWNDGTGRLSESGQSLALVETGRIGAGDLNGDGFVDLLFADRLRPAQVWLNDGKGGFSDSGVRLDESGACHGFAIADFDGDGDLDVFIANFLNPRGNSGLWFNQLRESR